MRSRIPVVGEESRSVTKLIVSGIALSMIIAVIVAVIITSATFWAITLRAEAPSVVSVKGKVVVFDLGGGDLNEAGSGDKNVHKINYRQQHFYIEVAANSSLAAYANSNGLLQLIGNHPLLANLKSGDKVTAKGIIGESGLMLADTASALTIHKQAKPRAALAPLRKAVVILLDIAGKTQSCNTSEISDLMYDGSTSVAEFYETTSYNQVSFQRDTDGDGNADVFGPFTISPPRRSVLTCNYLDMATYADAAATAAGVNLNLYHHRIYVMPKGLSCRWSGIGSIGCSGAYCQSWVTGEYCNTPDVYAHELGHNFGLKHANVDGNNDGRVDSEFGDLSCMMGNRGVGWRYFNAPHLAYLGWLPPQAITPVNTIGTQTLNVYDLETVPASGLGSERQAVSVVKGSTQDTYYLSYRTNGNNYSSGLNTRYLSRILLQRGDGAGGSAYITSLGDGQVYRDTVSGVTFTQESHTSNSALVKVTYNCLGKRPIATAMPIYAYSKTAAPAEYTVRVANKDPSCGATTTFSLNPIIPNALNATLSSSSLAIKPGRRGDITVSVAPVNAGTITPGAYIISVLVVDNDGVYTSHNTTSATMVYYFDNIAPPAPANLMGEVISNKYVSLTWDDATDAESGTAKYLIYRGNKHIGTSTRISYVDKLARRGATYSYSVKAVDKAGNASTSSTINGIEVPGR